jgi:hypothetical protein
MGETEERRANPRTPYLKPVLLDLIVNDSECLKNIAHEASGVDISKNGLGLLSGHPLKENDVLSLRIQIENGIAALPVFAKVAWATPAQDRYRAGLRFLS